jgi:nucleoside-diphosphate-sugar epimerase
VVDDMRDPVLILGCGFLGQVLAQKLAFAGVPVVGSARGEPQLGIIRTRGATPLQLGGVGDLPAIGQLPFRFGRVLMAIPPDANLDDALARTVGGWGLAPGRVLYVSSTSVFGDHGGADVDERTPPAPATDKARMRLVAEATWRAIGASVIRPAGIYGPGRSLLHRIAARKHRLIGDGRTITNRIHVGDLARLCEAALARGEADLYLGSDLAPTPQDEVVDWVSAELGLPAPPRISLAEARVRMTPEILAMFTQSKRLRAEATLARLGVTLRYPSYREGFRDIWARDKVALTALAASATP